MKNEIGAIDPTQIEISYETLWKSIIRPPRDEYDIDQLGEKKFYHKGKVFIRHDYELINKRGNLIKCSFLEHDINTRSDYLMPVVVYLHGNSSSRIEGFRNAPDLLKNGINIVIFDFAGCGLSEGEYISLGWYEKDDVKLIIDFVEKLPGVLNIGLWGRSMGAATTMFYAHSDPRIKAICMDSPFGDFKLLAKELCLKYITLPNFVLTTAMNFVKNTVKEKCGLDIDKLKPVLYANKTRTPAFFLHAVGDELINLEQTLELVDEYAGERFINVVEGGHNSLRQKHVLEKIAKFFVTYLYKENENEISSFIKVNQLCDFNIENEN
jgi:dipeptidyl aminopeptidase/acylaminoacyl peptidase